jgi:hypothetical protein
MWITKEKVSVAYIPGYPSLTQFSYHKDAKTMKEMRGEQMWTPRSSDTTVANCL